jgi:FtsP/CotA-like multicopper oxidase with cupredoxin domain
LAASPTLLRAESRIIDVGGRATKVFDLAREDRNQGLALRAGQDFREGRRDTVWLPPQVTAPVDASKPGKWTFHCRHLHHMATGMMTVVEYVG